MGEHRPRRRSSSSTSSAQGARCGGMYRPACRSSPRSCPVWPRPSACPTARWGPQPGATVPRAMPGACAASMPVRGADKKRGGPCGPPPSFDHPIL